jgi:hypothetical protein
VDQIYDQVIIDEINESLMKSVQQNDAPVVAMLLRDERVPSFIKLWRETNLDYYQTQANKEKS